MLSYIISIYFVFFCSFLVKNLRMFNLSRFLSLNLVARNCAKNSAKKLFASSSVLAESKDDRMKEAAKKRLPKSKSKTGLLERCFFWSRISSFSDPTVAAVFASLNETQPLDQSKSETPEKPVDTKSNISIDEIIMNAKTVNGLLSIAENNSSINRKHALKIVSILAEWSSINKVKLTDFENDARFTKLCRWFRENLPEKSFNQISFNF